jgi:hypothetical protein
MKRDISSELSMEKGKYDSEYGHPEKSQEMLMHVHHIGKKIPYSCELRQATALFRGPSFAARAAIPPATPDCASHLTATPAVELV